MTGNPFTRAALAEGLQICPEDSKSTWSEACSVLTTNAAGALLLSGFFHLLYFILVMWIRSQSVKMFKRVQKNRSVSKRDLSEAVSTDRAWKDQIAKLEAVKGPGGEVNGGAVHHSEEENPMIPASVSVSDSKVKQKILEKPEMVDAVDVKLRRGCSLLQSKVVLNQQSMSMLHNLAVDGTKKDEKFTVQLSKWRLFIHTAGGVKMLKLEDAHEVPTILRAAYAAGELTVEGFNLEGAEIQAATFDKCITVKDLKKEEVEGLQVWTSITRLPSHSLGEVFVYATKPICIDDHNVVVRSSVTSVQDHNLRILLRVGIPSTIGLIYIIILYIKLFSLDGWRMIAPAIVWIFPLIAMPLTQILPQSTEDAIEACIERIGLATAALYYGARRLVCQQDPELAGRRIAPLPQAPSPKNSDCQKQEKRVDHNKKHEKTERADSKMKKGSKIEEEPQCFLYEEYEDEVGRTLVRKRDFDGESADAKPSLSFKFIYGLKRKMWNERDYFKFYSESSLTAVFRKFLPDKFNFMGRKNVKLYASEFFHLRHELKQVLDSFSGEPSINIDQFRAHLKYFLQFLDTSCQEVSDRYEAMKKEGRVSWDMLWAFFPSDTKVVYRCAITSEEICGIAESTKYSFCERDGVPGFIIGLKSWDYNCQTWKPYSNLQRKIPQYSGPCSFTSLGTYPLQFNPNPHGEEKKFLAKGVWFGELSMQTRNRFMHYKGLMYCGKSGVKKAVNGRVMIGLASFAKMNPDHLLGTAAPPSDTLRTNQVELIDISTREDRMFAPTIVYGFSFQIKKWGAFNIDGFEEIVFNEAAYEALVMDPRKKDTIYSLVHEYKRSDETRERVDPIVGKGEGCILLCYGPPGTGKTFTAESISEKLHAPLWSLSVSELGTTPETLERKLVRILDVAASWGAILLLDEADVYLERRNSGTMDLERNAMTGIFLRNLEYYKGLLFLTTNRVVAFDDAFCSRISMFLYYEKHSEHDRRTIWKTLLENLEVPDLGEFLDTDYVSFELNAREIRNVVQVARTLAKTKGEEVNGGYLRHSLEMLASSLLELKRITGEPQTSSFKRITPPP